MWPSSAAAHPLQTKNDMKDFRQQNPSRLSLDPQRPSEDSPRARRSKLGPWVSRLGYALVGLVVTLILALTLGPRFLPYQTFVVLTGSMEPTIPVGSVIVLLPVDADQLVVGDVIAFERPDQTGTIVTHRIVGVDGRPDAPELITKGDANTTPDDWRVHASGRGWRHAFAIPYSGYVLRGAQAPIWRFALLVVPALLLGAFALVELWRPAPRRERSPA